MPVTNNCLSHFRRATTGIPLLFAFLIVFIVLLSACGGGTSSDSNKQAPTAATAVASGSPSSSGNAAAGQPPALDVCALLNVDDVTAVFHMRAKEQGQSDDGYVYSFKTEPQTYSNNVMVGGCRFTFQSKPPGESIRGAGILVIDATAASEIEIHRVGGKPIAGLGDEAVSESGTAFVRVGKYMLEPGESTVTQTFLLELYARMVPHVK
jgi:hypothetical protein